MSTEPTAFIVTHEEETGEEWPDGHRVIVTRIDGPLADKVRALYRKEGDVEIHQEGQEGGYSEFTVEWDWESELRVGGVRVWPAQRGGQPDWQYSEHDFRQGLVPKYGRPTALAQHLLDIRDGKARP